MNAQVNPKYLQGAVPEVDGKIVFSRAIKVNNSISDDKIFDLMNKWAQENYASPTNPKQRVLLSNAEDKAIACKGETNLTFRKAALMLDRAIMGYQLIFEIESGECLASIRNIRYEYDDKGTKDNIHTAEDMISDKAALNGEKLNRYYDKFRIHTVDSVNSIFNSIDIYLNGVQKREGAAAVIPAIPLTDSSPIATLSNATLSGFRQIAPDKIPGSINKLLNEDVLITSGSGNNLNVAKATWGGLGAFTDKSSAFCYLNPQQYSVTAIDKGDNYTISFYTEVYKDAMQSLKATNGKVENLELTPITTPSGTTAFAEAWMIIECKKTAIMNKEGSKDSEKMYIGEILNVWVK